MAESVLLLHAGVTLAMCGLIWFVQIVHYPLFTAVGQNEFTHYEREHGRRTGWIAGPLMIAEGITAAWLFMNPPPALGRLLPLIGAAVLLLIWGSTAFLQVPAHRRLESGFSIPVHRRLTRSNWIRTSLWTLRALLALRMLQQCS